MSISGEYLNITEICQATSLSTEVVIEIVQYGIVEPGGTKPAEWRFDAEMVSTLHKATRLQRELELDWSGIALAMDLIERVEQLRVENQRLKQLLNRFFNDEIQ